VIDPLKWHRRIAPALLIHIIWSDTDDEPVLQLSHVFYEYYGNLQWCTCKSATMSLKPVNKGNMCWDFCKI
jgi:hypothetical protein